MKLNYCMKYVYYLIQITVYVNIFLNLSFIEFVSSTEFFVLLVFQSRKLMFDRQNRNSKFDI